MLIARAPLLLAASVGRQSSPTTRVLKEQTRGFRESDALRWLFETVRAAAVHRWRPSPGRQIRNRRQPRNDNERTLGSRRQKPNRGSAFEDEGAT